MKWPNVFVIMLCKQIYTVNIKLTWYCLHRTHMHVLFKFQVYIFDNLHSPKNATLLWFVELYVNVSNASKTDQFHNLYCETQLQQCLALSDTIFTRTSRTRTWLHDVLVFVVAILSVTFVHPTQPLEIFGNVSMTFCSIAIHWPTCNILRRSSQGNPSVGGKTQEG